MISRRRFGLMSASAGFGLAAPSLVRAQGADMIRMANASGVIDSQLIFFTVGLHPRLDYYGKEKIKFDIINMSGAGSTMQAVATGNVEISPVSAPAILNVYAKNPNVDILAAYCWLRQAHWDIAVKPDSPLKTLAELKGKKIGIRNQGDTGFFGAKAMMKEIGLDPDKDVEWVAVGDGGPAGDAVYKGRIDAMAFWDGAFARIEIAGFPLRFLPRTEGMKRLFGNAYSVRKSTFAKNKELYARFFRAMAKSTVFAYANPELSIRLAWQVFPETKPKGKSEAQAMTEALKIVNIRKDKWFPGAWAKDQRFGAMSQDEWEAQVDFVGLKDKIKDVTPLFSNDLVAEVNKFDRKAIEAEAKAMKL